MSSGAFALPVDPAAGSMGGGTIERVIPLPPTFQQGAIPFSRGWLSLAYDDFDQGPVTIRVRVLTTGNVIRLDEAVQFAPGLTVVTEILEGDLAASFQYPAPGQEGGGKPVLSALVEFDD
jgi:hypothetical protein